MAKLNWVIHNCCLKFLECRKKYQKETAVALYPLYMRLHPFQVLFTKYFWYDVSSSMTKKSNRRQYSSCLNIKSSRFSFEIFTSHYGNGREIIYYKILNWKCVYTSKVSTVNTDTYIFFQHIYTLHDPINVCILRIIYSYFFFWNEFGNELSLTLSYIPFQYKCHQLHFFPTTSQLSKLTPTDPHTQQYTRALICSIHSTFHLPIFILSFVKRQGEKSRNRKTRLFPNTSTCCVTRH